MGMDVYGNRPKSDSGEYFRNNVWWWHPLWDYCLTIAPNLCEGVLGHSNDGDGLDEDGALELARLLFESVESGVADRYEQAYRSHQASLPRHKCDYCGGTGIRTDKVGQEMGMPTRELEADIALLLGRTHGWCNACSGEGTVEDFATNYPFTVENVVEFATFVRDSGGFRIC